MQSRKEKMRLTYWCLRRINLSLAMLMHLPSPQPCSRASMSRSAALTSALFGPVTRQRYSEAHREFVSNDIEQETGVRYRWESVLKSIEKAATLGLLVYDVGKVKGCSG